MVLQIYHPARTADRVGINWRRGFYLNYAGSEGKRYSQPKLSLYILVVFNIGNSMHCNVIDLEIPQSSLTLKLQTLPRHLIKSKTQLWYFLENKRLINKKYFFVLITEDCRCHTKRRIAIGVRRSATLGGATCHARLPTGANK